MSLTDDLLQRWGEIVDQVEKEHIPITCVKKVIFRTRDRKQKTVNIKKLRDQGIDLEGIEQAVQSFIIDNEEDIASMEFVLDIEAVADIVQPETDKILKGI